MLINLKSGIYAILILVASAYFLISAPNINAQTKDDSIRYVKDAFLEMPLERRKRLQSALSVLGLYTSSIDGLWGPGTEYAFASTLSEDFNLLTAENTPTIESIHTAKLFLNQAYNSWSEAEGNECDGCNAQIDKQVVSEVESDEVYYSSLKRLASAKEAFDNGYYEIALREWKPLAEQGFAEAQSGMGLLSSHGRGVLKDEEEAVKWFRLSAEQGWAQGQFNLGFMLSSGLGVKKDRTEALKWYRLSAEQQNARAQNSLGVYYANGWGGVDKDLKEAVKWYLLSAENGDEVAQLNLAHYYYAGLGVVKDSVSAHMWASIAVLNGNTKAVELRNRIAKSFTPAQLKLSQTLETECINKEYKGCIMPKLDKNIFKTSLLDKEKFSAERLPACASESKLRCRISDPQGRVTSQSPILQAIVDNNNIVVAYELTETFHTFDFGPTLRHTYQTLTDGKPEGYGYVVIGNDGKLHLTYEGSLAEFESNGSGTSIKYRKHSFRPYERIGAIEWVYTGDHVSGERTGYGELRFGAGIYKGQFINGKRNGTGEEIISKDIGGIGFSDLKLNYNGSFFKGLWKDNKRHGTGIETFPNGDTNKGVWTYNRKDGDHLVSIIKPNSFNKNRVETYQNGRLIKKVFHKVEILFVEDDTPKNPKAIKLKGISLGMTKQQAANVLIVRGYECFSEGGLKEINCLKGKASVQIDSERLSFNCHNFNVCPYKMEETARKLLSHIKLFGVMRREYDIFNELIYCSRGFGGDKVCVQKMSQVDIFSGAIRSDEVTFD